MNEKVSQESALLIGLGTIAISAIGSAAAAAIVAKGSKVSAQKAIALAKEQLKNLPGQDLITSTQSARVEPILLMDQSAANIPFIQDVVHSLYNLFTGYWLLSVSLDTTINGVSVGRRLDKFATDRDLTAATMGAIDMAFESMDIGLPYSKQIIQEQFESYQASLEANDSDMVKAINKLDEDDKIEAKNAEKPPVVDVGRVVDPGKIVQQITNLAVGQVVEVTIAVDGKEAKVPVMIRLRVAGMNPKSLLQTLAVGGVDMSFRGRFRAWRAGELSFWSDFVMAMDRVDAHRAASMNDETGYYKTVYSRATRNGIAEILGQGPSLATASAIIVITQDHAHELERMIGGKLSSFKVRQGIFGMTYSMLLAVVDPEWESVVIYTRGIDMPTKLNARDMKTAGKSDSKELMDILKSYQMGKAPGRP